MEALEEVANAIVEAIVDDLNDRGGIGDEWFSIDDEVQDEIRAAWKAIIIKHLRKEE